MSLAVTGLVFFAPGAAITNCSIKMSVTAERNAARVVIEIGMIDFKQLLFALQIRSAVVRFEFGERPGVIPIRRRGIFPRRGINDEETAVVGEIRMQGE